MKNCWNLVGRTQGINPQRMEMIPLEMTGFATPETFWLEEPLGIQVRNRGITAERITMAEVRRRCPKVISGLGGEAKSL